MLDFLSLTFFFLFAVLVPGFLFANFILPKKQVGELVGNLENFAGGVINKYLRYVMAPAFGLIILDVSVLIMAKLNLHLSFQNLFFVFLGINLVLAFLNFLIKEKKKKIEVENISISWKYAIIFSLIWITSVGIRTAFYLPDIVPQNTDLGHHMYWAQWMVQKEVYPVYDTPEVIEGEHMIFAVLSKLSGVTLLSALPLLILSFYNLANLLTISLLSFTLGLRKRTVFFVLFFSGIYLAIDPPQGKYVTGGVIGNTFGNYFTVLMFLVLFLFIRKWIATCKDNKKINYKSLVSLATTMLVILVGALYTHHLSTFLLLFCLATSFIIWILMTFIISKKAWSKLFGFLLKLIASPKFLLVVIFSVSMPLYVYLPYYLRSKAVETVTREPLKDTHLGFPLADFPAKMGFERFLFAIIAFLYLLIALLSYLKKKNNPIVLNLNRLLNKEIFSRSKNGRVAQISSKFKNVSIVFTSRIFNWNNFRNETNYSLLLRIIIILGWFLPLAVLSFYPNIVKIDLPSRRVVNYLIFPIIILGAMGAEFMFSFFEKRVDRKLFLFLSTFVGVVLLWNGTMDFRGFYSSIQSNFQDTVELYEASSYLNKNTPEDAIILKDHSNISGDSWIKFFLLRGYDYFLSRTYDYKYDTEDPYNEIDPCPRDMVNVPESAKASSCYGQTQTNYVILRPQGRDFLFWRAHGFNEIYVSDAICIFKRN